MDLDQDKLNAFLGRAVVDIGATLHAGLVVIGEKLGLYKALAAAEAPLTPAELAQRTETTVRYVREWLNAQAAGGYVTYHADLGRYSLTPEQAFTLADPESPAYLPGAFQLVTSAGALRGRGLRPLLAGRHLLAGEADGELLSGRAGPPHHAGSPVYTWHVHRSSRPRRQCQGSSWRTDAASP